jgi:predicted ATPase
MTAAITARKAREDNPLVGRSDELASLEEAVDGLERGSAGALVLLGEPGIGKTRLLRELEVRAEQRGYLVLSGSASELERDLPFSAFVDALDAYVESLDQDRLSARRRTLRTGLGEHSVAARSRPPQMERSAAHASRSNSR